MERWNLHRPFHRWVVAIGIVAILQGLFIAPLLLLTWSASSELLAFWEGMSGNNSAAETAMKIVAWLDHTITPLLQETGLKISFADLQERLRGSIQPIFSNFASYVGNALSATPQLLTFLLISWMAWVYFLVHGRSQRAYFLPRLIPWNEERMILASTLEGVLRAMVLTSIVLALVQSLMVLVTLGAFGIPKYYLWGAVAFFLSFIPIFGTAPVMISAAVYAFYADRTFAGIFILCMAVVIGLADNVMRPLLMKGSSEMSFFWLFLAIIGGVSMFGLPGAVLGPWAFSMFIASQALPSEIKASLDAQGESSQQLP